MCTVEKCRLPLKNGRNTFSIYRTLKNISKRFSVSNDEVPKIPLSLSMVGWIAIILAAGLQLRAPEDSVIRIMFWNLENFFDWRNDSTSVSDIEFSSRGARHWTRKRFYTKCNAVAKGILWAGSEKGGLPDAIGFAEIENSFVIKRLLQSTALRKLDYKLLHFESPDARGIDVALLYRTSRLKLTEAKPCHLYDQDSIILTTRDILLACFETRSKSNQKIAVLVNHHPSKYGGVKVSEPKRLIAVKRLRQLADSLNLAGFQKIVAMGDFNDTPANPVYRLLEPALVNLADSLYRRGKGTIKYDGAWELIDMFFAAPDCLPGKMSILQIPFLQTKDGAHSGTKPLRTYSGPRYMGGVSDHCPIWLEIKSSSIYE